LHEYDFDHAPFSITAAQIKEATKNFVTTGEREVRILCKQGTRENRPRVFHSIELIKTQSFKIIESA